jgi:hypothetical protein
LYEKYASEATDAFSQQECETNKKWEFRPPIDEDSEYGKRRLRIERL